MKTEKVCKGTGKALGHGCGELVPVEQYGKANRKYGLGMSCGCFKEWVKSTPNGQEYAVGFAVGISKQNTKDRKKEENQRHDEMRIETYGKENRQKLDKACQKLARMIDAKLGYITCIDCGILFGKQIDGGHWHSKGSNATLRWNLHNIHSQASHCNQNGLGGGKQLGYYEGIISRYSQEYADYVRFDIVRLFPVIKLSNKEVHEKLLLVNKIIRDIDTFQLIDGVSARRMFNRLIGIYGEQ